VKHPESANEKSIPRDPKTFPKRKLKINTIEIKVLLDISNATKFLLF
jgi:hypothetical protein